MHSAGSTDLATLVLRIVDQSPGTAFKAACDEDWRQICGPSYTNPDSGISPCGFVALVVAAEPPPTSASELSALSARLSDVHGYMQPRISALMKRVVASRKAYFSGDIALKPFLENAPLDALHPISGMVGQWEISDHLRSKSSREEGHTVCFLRNIQVGTLDSWSPSASEHDIFGQDPPNVQAWVAEERRFRSSDGSTLHFVECCGELLTTETWSRIAEEKMHNGGLSVIVDGRGHYWVHIATVIDGVPTIVRVDSIPHSSAEANVSSICVGPSEETIRAVLAGPVAHANLAERRSAVASGFTRGEHLPVKACRGGCGWDLGGASQEYCSKCAWLCDETEA